MIQDGLEGAENIKKTIEEQKDYDTDLLSSVHYKEKPQRSIILQRQYDRAHQMIEINNSTLLKSS